MSELYHTGFPMYRLAFFAVFCMMTTLLSGCKPATIPPTATNIPTPRPTPVVIFATRAPSPTPSLVPTQPVDPSIQRLVGNWIFTVDYLLLGYPFYSNIHYSGTLKLTVSDDGSIFGGGDIYTNLEQPPCNAIIADGSDLSVSLSGQLVVTNNTADAPIATMQIVPTDPNMTQTFQLDCKDNTLKDRRVVALLWPALATTDQLQVQFPFKRGKVLTDNRNLTAATGGSVHGTLLTEMRIG